MKSKNKHSDKAILIETLMVISITILLFIIFPAFNSYTPLIAAVYLLAEKRIRNRTWSEIGFKPQNTLSDLKKNWYFILLAGTLAPIFSFLGGKYFVPGFIEHVKARLSLNIDQIVPTIIVIAIGTFLEELIFRGFLQGRLECFITPFKSILISASLFAFMHFSNGTISIVAWDLFGIFLDSILYGIIFAKTHNIITSWIAHFLADLVGLLCLFMI